MRYFVVGPVHSTLPRLIGDVRAYQLVRRNAERFARKIDRELAKGPTHYISDNYYGPVELWPLVIEEGEEDSLSR